jgi:predicted  nucleic acid-binding Zn-ribbon protein
MVDNYLVKLHAVSPALSALIALQHLDSTADAARRRLADLPAAEQAIAAGIATARGGVDAAKARIQENALARRALDKDIAGVDVRLARFDDHKAAVKTNQEYTALLHEISVAKGEKTAIEDKLLVLMEEAEALAAQQKSAEAALAAKTSEGEKDRAALAADRKTLEAEIARLSHERAQEARNVDAPVIAKYEQLLKQRKGIAVARMSGGEICEACHVRLRPHVAQMVRRNESIVPCDSCQRILYFEPPPAGVSTT